MVINSANSNVGCGTSISTLADECIIIFKTYCWSSAWFSDMRQRPLYVV